MFNGTLTNISLMKGKVPKRLDICYYFGTFSNILNFCFLTVVRKCHAAYEVLNFFQFLTSVSRSLDKGNTGSGNEVG